MEFSMAIFGDGVELCRHIIHSQSHVPATLSVLATAASTILPVDSSSAAPRAAVRCDPYRPPPSVPRAPARRMRRIRRRSVTEDGGEDGFSGDGNGDDGPFGGGGNGWGSWRPGGSSWEDPDRRWWSSSDPAFDAVYEFLCWIALSNCTHFAFKKIGRLLAEREKDLSIRLVLALC
ncbi:hypothetical protein KSP39_PZI002692 [Platanthera zijinensis]|uniref:Uncharacterized protein n=1 Tax=Platanthera zijinensis TaxID=2320716 RepID=A0AAP0C0K9_9ASPA